jgi:hypothetical protein
MISALGIAVMAEPVPAINRGTLPLRMEQARP